MPKKKPKKKRKPGKRYRTPEAIWADIRDAMLAEMRKACAKLASELEAIERDPETYGPKIVAPKWEQQKCGCTVFGGLPHSHD